MADKDFIVKNGLVVNTTFTANSSLVNAAAINVTNQVNTATLYAATSANVGTTFTTNSSVTNAISFSTGNNFTANNTGVYANTINAANTYTVTGNGFIANSIGVYANAVVNSLSFTAIGYIANSTGVYANAVVNAASHTVGNNFVATSSAITLGANITVNTSSFSVGNSSSNTVIAANSITLNGNSFISAAGYYRGNYGAYGNPQGVNNLFRINANTQTANITIAAGENALAAGPLVVSNGFNLTVQSGGRAVIV